MYTDSAVWVCMCAYFLMQGCGGFFRRSLHLWVCVRTCESERQKGRRERVFTLLQTQELQI